MFATPFTDSRNKVQSVPAPIGGLNARDSLIAMDPTDAIIMRNWWPQPYGVSLRKGYRLWSSGMTGTVHSLASIANMSGSEEMYAWAGTEFFAVSSDGPVGAAALTGLTDAPWQHIQLVNSAGAHLIAVNGEDDAIHVTGGVVSRYTLGDGIVPGTWAGLNPELAVQVTVHQHRLWAVEKGTANGWYLPPDAVQGTFVKYDFGPLFPNGGYLLFLTTWTMDDGNGAEDHLVGLSSKGDAVVFSGTDPSDDTKWSLVGVYFMGAPVAGRRAYAKVGGDLIILTQQGAASMTETLVSTKVENRASKLRTDKIQFAIAELVTAYSARDGWQVAYFPETNMLMINVPTSVAAGNIQLASNQLINSWTQFTNMDAAVWTEYTSRMYFGDYDGNVWLAWDNYLDGVDLDGLNGNAILAECQQAYSYLGKTTTQKQVGLYRPNFVVTASATFNSAIVYDFKTPAFAVPDTSPPISGSLWGVGLWGISVWSGATSVQRAWVQAQGMGSAASIQMSLRSTAEILWVATDYSWVEGEGIL